MQVDEMDYQQANELHKRARKTANTTQRKRNKDIRGWWTAWRQCLVLRCSVDNYHCHSV